MTTLVNHEGYAFVAETLDRVEQRHRRTRLLAGITSWVGISLGTLVAVTLTAGLLRLGSHPGPAETFARYVLLVILLGVPVVAGFWAILRPLLERRTPLQIARSIEECVPGLNNGLINTLQLAGEPDAGPQALVWRAIGEAAGSAERVVPEEVVGLGAVRRWVLVVAAALVILIGYGAVAGGTLRNSLISVLRPREFIAHAGRIAILKVEPGDARVLADKPLNILVEVDNKANEPLDARLIVLRPDGSSLVKKMVPFGGTRQKYKHSLGPVAESFRYRIEVEDSQTPIHSITVIERVHVESIELYYRYPPYTKLPPRQSTDPNIEAPIGTKVEFTLRLDMPVGTARLETAGGQRLVLNDAGGQTFSGTLAIARDDQYAIVLLDRNDQELHRVPDARKSEAGASEQVSARGQVGSASQGYWPIRIVPDRPPKVQIAQPGRDIAASPGSKVEVVAKASDDYRVRQMAIHFKKGKEGEGDFSTLAQSDRLDDPKNAVLKGTIPIDKEHYKEGDIITYYASATDNREIPGVGGNQTTPTDLSEAALFRILVQDKERMEKDRLARMEELRKRLEAILQLQIRVKADTLEARHQPAGPARNSTQEKVHTGQAGVQRELISLGETFGFDDQTADMKQAILLLGHNEAVAASAAAAMLRQVTDPGKHGKAIEELLGLQQQIISALETLIGVVGDLKQTKVEGEQGKLGGDLPPDLMDKLQKLQGELARFMEQQKKVIEGSKYLAKRPVDNYTEQEARQLEELKAMEDQWEKFMTEMITDFSKMAEQDFSDAALLQEMIEVRDDLKMAKDALAKKATEIAVPFEESGLELAENMTTHIEKWLSDQPDRQAWKMEEPLNEQTDVPMAELPKELEDLIGDLMEEEEDLFEEMDDVTSKWTDSIDKGAGWDALDGPISNMSAQGVTGNHLPNTSEIGGRSGQGRSGKSVGEMVEDSAHDLGGRRTPTRLSHDPFQKGDIKDTSKEDGLGGATGGGKLSGSGGEGLEGPVPPELQRELGRLSQKQAALRNKAEKINLAFEVKNYKNFKLPEVIRAMRRTEDDLTNFRYQNALRRKDVVIDGLRGTKMLVDGKIAVQEDTSPSMPRQVRDDIADAMQGEMPKGFRDLLKKYYENLSAAGATTRP